MVMHDIEMAANKHVLALACTRVPVCVLLTRVCVSQCVLRSKSLKYYVSANLYMDFSDLVDNKFLLNMNNRCLKNKAQFDK